MTPVRRTPARRARIRLSLLAVLAALLVAAAGCRARGEDPRAIVARVKESYARVTDYRGRVTYEVFVPGEVQKIVVEQAFLRPDRYRSEVLEPEMLRGQLTVFDGTALWFYSPQDREAVRLGPQADGVEQEEELLGHVVDELAGAGRLTHQGDAVLAGRRAVVLQLPITDPALAPAAGRKVWIDRESWLPLRVETVDGAGRPLAATGFEAIRTNVGLTGDDFAFTPPPGVNVREAGGPGDNSEVRNMTLAEAEIVLGFRPLVPTELPSGYRLTAVTQVGEGPQAAVVLDYGSGDRMLSLTQMRFDPARPAMAGAASQTWGGFTAQVLETDDFTILRWVKDGVELVLLGNLPKEQLFSIARSIR